MTPAEFSLSSVRPRTKCGKASVARMVIAPQSSPCPTEFTPKDEGAIRVIAEFVEITWKAGRRQA